MKKKKWYYITLVMSIIVFIPSYSQNVVNTSLSIQEMKNGISLFNERKYTAAIQAFELSLSYEPLNHAAKYRLGLAFLYAGYAQNAVRVWEELVELGVADYQVIEQLNNLYFKISLDDGYDYEDPYIFREYYDGFTQGGHDVFRTSFIEYDPNQDLKFVSSVAKRQVVVLDNANNIISKYGARLFRPSLFSMPMGIALYSNLIYISDYKLNKIFVLKRDAFGSVEFTFGETGAKENQISGPMGLAFSDNYLYIVDNGNQRIQKFLPDGSHVYSFGSQYLYRPTDIIVDENFIYVTDINNRKKGRLVVFDKDGNFVTNIGEKFLKEPRGLYLDNKKLYISDAVGYLYIYDTESKTTSTFANGEKLVTPFDVIKDRNKMLWRTDFNSEKLAVYTPLQALYGNISLEIPQILTDSYPYVYALVRARNRNGMPITRISKEELTLTEFDLPVKDLLVNGITNYRDKMKLTFVVDKSLKSEQYLPQLEYYLKSFLSNTTGNDLVNMVLVDDKIYQSDFQISSVSQVWSYITNHQSQSELPVSWDVPIYDAITGLLNNFRNRAVIVFTSGEGYQDSFSEYGADIVKTYADQNSIPVYVVNFGTKNDGFWRKIATESHGKYMQSDRNARDILDLYSLIKNSPPLEYLVEYEAYNYHDHPDLWIDMVLKLERFGISGVVSSGYYVPEPKKRTLNLWNQFFPSNNQGQ